jgi:hypothetical protein
MPSAIEMIVDVYVKAKNITALNQLKEHRQRLIRSLADREHFDLTETRRSSEEDLAVIEDGLRKVTEVGGMAPLSSPPTDSFKRDR